MSHFQQQPPYSQSGQHWQQAPPVPVLEPKDESHLSTLSILYYVFGGLSIIGGCFLGLFSIFGIGALASGSSGDDAAAAAILGIVMVIATLISLAIAAVEIHVGNCLRQRKSWTFCLVIACLVCTSFPLGTALGVFTILVLVRPTVKAAFGKS
jgi:hypothetical protein